MRSGFVMVLLLLSSCAQITRVADDARTTDTYWSLKGKIGVSAGKDRGNFGIDWQQQGEDFEINLLGPLGIGVARLRGDEGGVLLQLPGKSELYAATADELLVATMGLNIPVSQMKYWVRGVPAPGRSKKTARGFIQLGWTVEYLEYQKALPVRIKASRPEVNIAMVIRQWIN